MSTLRRLPSQAELRLQRSIMNKRIAHSLASKEETATKRFLFTQFLVLGAPLEALVDPKPHVLAVYPSNTVVQNEGELNQVCEFCFPAGFAALSKSVRQDNTLLNGFVFNIKVGAKPMFGLAIHFCISKKSGSFFCSGFNRHYPFCMCLLSEFPFYASHMMFLTHVALMSIGISKFSNQNLEFKFDMGEAGPKDDAVYYNFETPLPDCLELDHLLPQFAVMAKSKIRCPHFLLTELHKYILFRDPKYIPTDMSMSQAITFFGYQFLFSSLSIKNIVTLYSAMLLEYQVLFFSKDLNRLSFSIAGAQGLIYPFQPGVLVFPVLPVTHDFIQILDSPVPIMCGIHYSVKAYEKGDVIVDLDRDKVVVRTRVPDLPRQSELVRKLELIMGSVEERIEIPSKNKQILSFTTRDPNPEYIQFVQKADPFMYPPCFESLAHLKYTFSKAIANSIRHAFESHLVPWLTENITNCFVTDVSDGSNGPVTVCNKDLFLYLISDNERDFYNAFVQTNSFETFCSRLADDFEETKTSPEPIRVGWKSMNIVLPGEETPK